MTTSEVERLSRMLTEMRIESAAQFATVHAHLENMQGLSVRMSALEAANASNGKFTWSDVFKFIAAGATLLAAAYTLTHWG